MGHAQLKLPAATAAERSAFDACLAGATLTVALPTGPAGQTFRALIAGMDTPSVGPISIVPAWSSASLAVISTPRGQGFDELELFEDEWAAVAGRGWRGGCDFTARDLASLPLVATTPEEHEAWHLLLEGNRPRNLRRVSRAEAQIRIATGAALGIANVPLLEQHSGYTPVSRCHTWPGSGLWASLHAGAPARDRGWALAMALQQAFRGTGAQAAN